MPPTYSTVAIRVFASMEEGSLWYRSLLPAALVGPGHLGMGPRSGLSTLPVGGHTAADHYGPSVSGVRSFPRHCGLRAVGAFLFRVASLPLLGQSCTYVVLQEGSAVVLAGHVFREYWAGLMTDPGMCELAWFFASFPGAVSFFVFCWTSRVVERSGAIHFCASLSVWDCYPLLLLRLFRDRWIPAAPAGPVRPVCKPVWLPWL